MRLHEEYILRNRLRVPIVRYEPSSLFLQILEPPISWAVCKIEWRTDKMYSSPGSFYMKNHRPVHNGYRDGELFVPLWTKAEEVVPLEDYDRAMISYAKCMKAMHWKVVPEKERQLVAWQMFLHIYDGWIAHNTAPDFHRLIEESINTENNFNVRSMAFRQARRYLEGFHRREWDVLNYQILPMARGHSSWLEKLINDC